MISNELHADFTVGWVLSVSVEGSGTVDVDPHRLVHRDGEEVSLSAVPETGWAFSHWMGDLPPGTGDSEEIDVTMDRHRHLTAVFSEEDPTPPPPPPPPDEHTLTIRIEGRGSLDPEPGEHTLESGSEVTVTARPDAPFYRFGHWLVDGERVEVDASPLTIDLLVESDMTVTGVFTPPPPEWLEIQIPPLAGPDAMELLIFSRDADEEVCPPHGPIDGLVFDVVGLAESGDVDSEIREFDGPVGVELGYSDEVTPGEAARIHIHRWCEDLRIWIPLPTAVDASSRRASAEIEGRAVLAMCPVDSYTDIRGHWSRGHVLLLSKLGVIRGYGDGSFRPDARVTREEFATMLVEALGLPTPERDGLWFDDSDAVSAWASPYVFAAARRGIVAGYGDNTFRPREPINRAEMAGMIARASDYESTDSPSFADVPDIPDWARGPVAALAREGLVGGYPDGSFHPGRHATRAEVSVIMARLVRAGASEGDGE